MAPACCQHIPIRESCLWRRPASREIQQCWHVTDRLRVSATRYLPGYSVLTCPTEPPDSAAGQRLRIHHVIEGITNQLCTWKAGAKIIHKIQRVRDDINHSGNQQLRVGPVGRPHWGTLSSWSYQRCRRFWKVPGPTGPQLPPPLWRWKLW